MSRHLKMSRNLTGRQAHCSTVAHRNTEEAQELYGGDPSGKDLYRGYQHTRCPWLTRVSEILIARKKAPEAQPITSHSRLELQGVVGEGMDL